MSKDLTDKYASRPAAAVEVKTHENPCYAVAADGARNPLMVEFEQANGDQVALPYSFLMSIDHDRSGRIQLSFSTHEVILTGRNLKPLFDLFKQHRVRAAEGVGEFSSAVEPDVVVYTVNSRPYGSSG